MNFCLSDFTNVFIMLIVICVVMCEQSLIPCLAVELAQDAVDLRCEAIISN